MNNHRQRARVAMQDILCKCTDYVLEPGKIKFIRDREDNKTKVYAISGPVTNTDQYFEITNASYKAKVVPYEASKLIDYIKEMDRLMSYARDFQAYDDDLRPWNKEERVKFGVRTGKHNPCFPTVLSKIDPRGDLQALILQHGIDVAKDLW